MADPQETQVASLVINKLTKAQYQALVDAGTVSATELYVVPDEGSSEAAWGNITGTLSNQTDLQSALDAKQATLTAGTGISIENNVISNTQTSAEWGKITGTLSSQTDLQSALNAKQNTLTAGTNIQISGNTISATDTTYTAGDNISISGTTISAVDTKVQSAVSSTNTNYPILLNNGTTATTSTALIDTGVYANPSTNTIGADNVGIANAVTLSYNSSTEALDFVFA